MEFGSIKPGRAARRTARQRTDPSTDRPTNGIRPKTTTASDRKSVELEDSVENRINSVLYATIYFLYTFLFLFSRNVSALGPRRGDMSSDFRLRELNYSLCLYAMFPNKLIFFTPIFNRGAFPKKLTFFIRYGGGGKPLVR